MMYYHEDVNAANARERQFRNTLLGSLLLAFLFVAVMDTNNSGSSLTSNKIRAMTTRTEATRLFSRRCTDLKDILEGALSDDSSGSGQDDDDDDIFGNDVSGRSGHENEGPEEEDENEIEHGPEHEDENETEHGPEHEDENETEHGPEHEDENETEHGPEHEDENETEHGPEHEDETEHGPEHEDENETEHGPEHD